MSFLSKIKSFFITREEKSLEQFFADYLAARAELQVSDIKASDQELNFKVTWKGSTVPFWLSSKYKVEDALSVIAVGLTFGLNLVEISQALRK